MTVMHCSTASSTAAVCTCQIKATIYAARTSSPARPARQSRQCRDPFPLHPRVMVSLIGEGNEEALLRLPSGIGWRFHQSGGILKLEDFVYLGEDSRPRKTKQLVVYGDMPDTEFKVKWAMQREGL